MSLIHSSTLTYPQKLFCDDNTRKKKLRLAISCDDKKKYRLTVTYSQNLVKRMNNRIIHSPAFSMMNASKVNKIYNFIQGVNFKLVAFQVRNLTRVRDESIISSYGNWKHRFVYND